MTEYDDSEPKPYTGIVFHSVSNAIESVLYSPAGTVIILLAITLNIQAGRLVTATTTAGILFMQAIATYTEREPLTWFINRIAPSHIDENSEIEFSQWDYLAALGVPAIVFVIAMFGGQYGSLIGLALGIIATGVFARVLSRRVPRKVDNRGDE